MKKLILIPALLLMAFAIQDANTGNATAEQVEGYYIFLMSKPVKAYEYLGTVKAGITWNGQPEENFRSILKRVKKDYPKADGIIFQDISLKKVDAIKFK